MRATANIAAVREYVEYVPATEVIGRVLAANDHGAGIARVAKNVALFVAAPFIGLAYAVAFPFIGIGVLAWMGIRAAAKRAARA